MNTCDVLKYGHLTLLSTLNAFPAGEVYKPGACGVWSVKDIVAHLASYEQALVDVLSTLLGDAPTPYLNLMGEQGNAFNDIQVGERRDRTFEEVLAEYQDAYGRAMALAGRIPAESYRQNGTLPWYGAEYDLDDYVVYTFYGHKREHSAQVAAFCDLLSR